MLLFVCLFLVLRNEALRIANGSHPPDMSSARHCLQATTPSLVLNYPSDAEDHFTELHRSLEPFSHFEPHCTYDKDFCGPWVENVWMDHFRGLWQAEKEHAGKKARLSSVFGPYIPILFPFVDSWVNSDSVYPEGFVAAFRAALRSDVAYVTVSQNDQGLAGFNEIDMTTIPNILVLSAGGYGHVPIPLVKQSEPVRNQTLLKDRSKVVSFLGSLENAPNELREKVVKQVTEEFEEHERFTGIHDEWRDIMADSRVSLCPRGFGRTSYHLYEAIHMGLVPVYVYSDIPWLPYGELFDSFGFKTSIDALPSLLQKLRNVTDEELMARTVKMLALKESHYTLAGTMGQIHKFLTHQGSDLECTKLPSTVRDE